MPPKSTKAKGSTHLHIHGRTIQASILTPATYENYSYTADETKATVRLASNPDFDQWARLRGNTLQASHIQTSPIGEKELLCRHLKWDITELDLECTGEKTVADIVLARLFNKILHIWQTDEEDRIAAQNPVSYAVLYTAPMALGSPVQTSRLDLTRENVKAPLSYRTFLLKRTFYCLFVSIILFCCWFFPVCWSILYSLLCILVSLLQWVWWTYVWPYLVSLLQRVWWTCVWPSLTQIQGLLPSYTNATSSPTYSSSTSSSSSPDLMSTELLSGTDNLVTAITSAVPGPNPMAITHSSDQSSDSTATTSGCQLPPHMPERSSMLDPNTSRSPTLSLSAPLVPVHSSSHKYSLGRSNTITIPAPTEPTINPPDEHFVQTYSAWLWIPIGVLVVIFIRWIYLEWNLEWNRICFDLDFWQCSGIPDPPIENPDPPIENPDLPTVTDRPKAACLTPPGSPEMTQEVN
ncbi:hypothetical protein VTL71DRAFT_840 [Oculimacula yallundae]|uniref:Uncharacterized protein n=1 Tax=Oculimacula yallundae TaxID=86028 RepID=A0ABR4D176_9HELO